MIVTWQVIFENSIENSVRTGMVNCEVKGDRRIAAQCIEGELWNGNCIALRVVLTHPRETVTSNSKGVALRGIIDHQMNCYETIASIHCLETIEIEA